jgi:hypothetical protein
MKIALNKCYGGFSFSEEALKRLKEKGVDTKGEKFWTVKFRTDPRVIEVVEELLTKASGESSKIEIEEIPEPNLEIKDHDGKEYLVLDGRILR